MTPELNYKIAQWRQKQADGTLTLDDMREAIREMRAGRASAAVASASSKTRKTPVVAPSSDDLLRELEEGL